MSSEKPPFVWGFQSPEVTEIFVNMSKEEKRLMQRLLTRNAIVLGVTIAAASMALRHWLHLKFPFFRDVLLSSVFSFLAGLLWLPWTNRSMRTFFLSTAYAKSRGVHNLRLYSFFRKRSSSL